MNDNFCPEYDTYEGNKYTMVSTLHTCDYVAPNYYPNCDRGGCGTNAFNFNPNMMCPEDRCTINTNKPYVISHSHSKVRLWNHSTNVYLGCSLIKVHGRT